MNAKPYITRLYESLTGGSPEDFFFENPPNCLQTVSIQPVRKFGEEGEVRYRISSLATGCGSAQVLGHGFLETVPSFLKNPFYLKWEDAEESVLIYDQTRDGAFAGGNRGRMPQHDASPVVEKDCQHCKSCSEFEDIQIEVQYEVEWLTQTCEAEYHFLAEDWFSYFAIVAKCSGCGVVDTIAIQECSG